MKENQTDFGLKITKVLPIHISCDTKQVSSQKASRNLACKVAICKVYLVQLWNSLKRLLQYIIIIFLTKLEGGNILHSILIEIFPVFEMPKIRRRNRPRFRFTCHLLY
jgi:hypothetical protein